MELSTAAIIEKNKTASNGADLLLCDITCRDESLHLVANNEKYCISRRHLLRLRIQRR